MFFFFNDTATTEIYTLSLHDALPIWRLQEQVVDGDAATLEIALELRSARADLVRPCEGVHPLLQRSLRGRHLELGWSLHGGGPEGGIFRPHARSGKGRVGKEGKSRGVPDRLKKKT